jgi:hypothetical protein
LFADCDGSGGTSDIMLLVDTTIEMGEMGKMQNIKCRPTIADSVGQP